MIFEKPVKKSERPVVVFLHGFGSKRTGELQAFKDRFENDYDILMPEYFDPADPDDCSGILWAQRCLHTVQTQLLKQRKVILAGFSMGGVIATWIASVVHVEKLILLAPAYDLINFKNTGNIINSVISHMKGNGMTGQMSHFDDLPSSFYQTLFDVVLQYRDSCSKIDCPVLLIQGNKDTIVSLPASRICFHKMPSDQKQLFVIEEGHHVLLQDEGVVREVLGLIQLFLDDLIVIR